jgi:CRISPR-associated protein Csy1
MSSRTPPEPAEESDARALYALAQRQERAGDRAAAIANLTRAVTLDSQYASAHQLLGILYGEGGDAERAAAAFARVVALEPDNARAHNNLGNALRTLGRRGEARAAFERAVALRPGYELATANLAMACRDAGDSVRAEQLLREALGRPSAKPPLRALVVLLAGLLRERGALDEAASLYERAIAMAPAASSGEWFNLGQVLNERDETERARTAYGKAHAADRRDLRGAIASRLALPMIAESASAVAQARDAYARGLGELHAMSEHLVAGLAEAEALDGLRWTNFFLAYQGGDDRALQASYGEFAANIVTRSAPEWRESMAARDRGARLRVGFASAFFHVGTAGRYFRSWITDLDRDRFEVCVYHLFPGEDDIATQIKARADRFVEFGGSRARPSVIASVIHDDALDVLVYPELGMDHTTFALAALRLASRLWAGWGHPVTTGHGTIDAFVTCEAMEPEDAAAHYVERLLKLPGIGTCYRRPVLPDPVGRATFGLPEDRCLFLCPQSLFKIHPDNDELFARVLAANSRAALVLFDGRHPRVTSRFMERLTRAFDRHGVSARERIIVLPALSHDDYLRVNRACDAMLDTLHWSGGNTSLDALACGLPVVTLPGAYMRGRQSAAMLRIIGAEALIASDLEGYVRIASQIAGDTAWRDEQARTIRDGNGALFDRPEPVQAFSELLLNSM